MDDTFEPCQYTNRSPPSSGCASSYAFLNHSAITLPNNLPPNVDDKPLARQKRKRTSPEDQAILEAAYGRDPKPDKAARVELIKQVALGDKEVQIWFQNRRQSSRRKSRPLLPHEVAQYQLLRSGGACHVSSTDLAPNSTFDDNDASNPVMSGETAPDQNHCEPPSPVGASGGAGTEPEANLSLLAGRRIEESYPSPRRPAPSSLAVPQCPAPERPGAATTKHHHDEIASFAFLANRRSLPSLRRISSANEHSPVYHHVTDVYDPTRQPQSSASLVRLSMTAEGNAKIVNKDASEPSPPRPAQILDMGLGNNHKLAQPKIDPLAAPNLKPTKPLQRSSSGRSRDSRAWEFWCDKDSRSELEDKAEKDASGSAANAIGLLRSASGRSILGTIPSKRNSALSRQQPTTFQKRSKLGHTTRPSLNKSSTSLGRLQADRHDNPAQSVKPTPKLQHSVSAASAWISGNDSDKENWSPEMKPQTDEHSENIDPESNSEIAAFMRGGRKSPPPEEDLDCVQGLLSLSQGNWR